MELDILCPGTWQDSYESRMLGEGSWHMPVNNMNDVLLVVQQYFNTESGKREQELFNDFNLYLDGDRFGDYSHGEITVFPLVEWVDIMKGSYRYKFGNKGYVLPVDTCLAYGINSRTVKPDTKHVW